MFEIFFISYKEKNAEKNWELLSSKFPVARRIDGIVGIKEAHLEAARQSATKMFYVVDGDAEILDDFTFDHKVATTDFDVVHIWRSRNPVNGLEYGYGGVKLLPKDKVLNMDLTRVDMTTSLSDRLVVMPTVANITAFNTDPFSAWRSAFRECAKLASNVIDRSVDTETKFRLDTWCTQGREQPYGEFTIKGALAGRKYAEENSSDISKINDFKWLLDQFWESQISEKSKPDTLCAVPWMHLNFEPNGKVIPCCLTSTFDYFAGDLTTQSIDEVWNSSNMKKLRKEMINGIEPKVCVKCFQRERITKDSSRVHHNKEFKKVIDIIPEITLPDGTCTTMDLKYWDFRFSNLCNYKCRSCGPRYSSSWVPDAKKMRWITEQDKVWNIASVNEQSNYAFLKEQVLSVEKVYFAGGEPLLMAEHWDILSLLEENNRYDVKVCYNTNVSTLVYNKKNVLDIWKKWNPGQLEVWPSIDEVGPRAELIRSGTDWPNVEENLKKILELDNIFVKPGITVGAMNVFRMPELIQYLTDIGIISAKYNHKNFFLNQLEWPMHYHVHILSDKFRQEIVAKLENFITDYNFKYTTNIDHLFAQLLFELKKPFNLEEARKFVDVTARLDVIRNENIYETIPELNDVLENLKNYDA